MHLRDVGPAEGRRPQDPRDVGRPAVIVGEVEVYQRGSSDPSLPMIQTTDAAVSPAASSSSCSAARWSCSNSSLTEAEGQLKFSEMCE